MLPLALALIYKHWCLRKVLVLYYSVSDCLSLFRMIPASSKAFLLTNLVSGVRYDLCVLAAWDDTATTLTATNVVGCTHFYTQEDYPVCQSLPSRLLGGTMILVVGGIIVATLLIFIVILMVRYKSADPESVVGKLASVTHTHSQTNGGRLGQNGMFMFHSQSQSETKVKAKDSQREEVVRFKTGSLQSSLTASSSSSSGSMDGESYSPNSTLASIWRSAHAKHRPNLDHLLGALASFDLHGTQGHDPGASGSTVAMAATARTDREPLLGRALDSSLSRLLLLSTDSKPKRSQSFDMGNVTSAGATQLCSKPRRLSSIWTKRSLSVNGTLLQCEEEEGDTGGSKGTLDSADWVMESTV